MIAEDIEFLISQYADGTLSPAERTQVDDLLKSDPAARSLLAEYARLDGHLRAGELSGPSINWDRLGDHISNNIDSEMKPAVAGRIGFASAGRIAWTGKLRIAAAILIVVTVGLLIRHTHQTRPTPIAPSDAVLDVTGPVAEAPAGKPSEDISVEPSQLARGESGIHYANQVVVPARSRVVLSEAYNKSKSKNQPN
jgi:anti-sigma factor RsiW